MGKPELMLLAWLAGIGSAAGVAYLYWQASVREGSSG